MRQFFISLAWLTLSLVMVLAMTAGAAHAAEEGSFFGSGWTLFWRIINFGILAFAIYKVGKKPLSDFFGGKQAEAKAVYEQLEEAKAAAEAELAELKERLVKADEEMANLVEQLKSMAAKKREQIISEAKATAEETVSQASLAAENEAKAARAQLVHEAGMVIVAKAGELIKQRITDDDQERLITEALAGIASSARA